MGQKGRLNFQWEDVHILQDVPLSLRKRRATPQGNVVE